MQLPAALEVLRPDLRAERRPLAAAGALGVVGVVIDLVRPWPLALAVDVVATGGGRFGLPATAALIACGVTVVMITAAGGWVDAIGTVRAEQAAERVGARLRGRVFEQAVHLSLRWHDETRSGELLSRLTTDVGRLLDALVTVCVTVVPDALRLVVILAVLSAVDPWLALVGLAVVPTLAVLAVRQRRRVRSAQDDARAASGSFAATAVDLLRNVRAVQAFARADLALDRLGCANARLRAANIRAVAVEARWAPRADVTLAVGTGLVLSVGGAQALRDGSGPGQLVVVMTYLSALYSPVRSLSRLAGTLAKAGASSRRVRGVIDRQDRIVGGEAVMPARPNEIRFDDVTFGYEHGRPVLDRFTLTLRAGETVCLFGPSGMGKSTVLHLLLRLYDVESGTIRIDGVDLRDLDLADLRRHIAFVPQDPWLLDTSIADNIAFGAERPTRHAILRAARLARVDEFAAGLPHGYDTVVGEGGARLSGGQRRRVAIARALMSAAPIMLLDEPTASLDADGAALIVDAVRTSLAGRTVLLVTHDRRLASLADHVVPVRATDDRPRPVASAMSDETREEVSA